MSSSSVSPPSPNSSSSAFNISQGVVVITMVENKNYIHVLISRFFLGVFESSGESLSPRWPSTDAETNPTHAVRYS
jgi:hypothetical protein